MLENSKCWYDGSIVPRYLNGMRNTDILLISHYSKKYEMKNKTSNNEKKKFLTIKTFTAVTT